jgi:hypothetical protein
VKDLKERYQSEVQNLERVKPFPPEGVEPFPPTIPFVGHSYFTAPLKLLVYGSAENLAVYRPDRRRGRRTPPSFLGDHRAHDRHRAARDEQLNRPEELSRVGAKVRGEFPYLHLAPADDGSLLCAARFILEDLCGVRCVSSPGDFLEQIAIGNFFKFARSTNEGKNLDRAGRRADIDLSLPFVRGDLTYLKPDIVFLPRTTFDLLDGALPVARPTKVIGAMQFNSGNINRHLPPGSDLDAPAQAIRTRHAERELGQWVSWLHYKEQGAWRYLAHLENRARSVLADIRPQNE